MFLLEQSWFFMRFFYRLFGLFPLERVEEADLKPTSACRFWIRYIITSTLVMSIFVGPICYATNFKDYALAFVAVIGISVYDMMSVAATFIVQFGLHVKCLSMIRSFGKRFSDLQHFVNAKITMEPNDMSGNRLKFYSYVLPNFIFSISFTILNPLGWNYSLKSKLNLSYLETNLITISFIIFNTVALNPLYYLLTLYIEVTIKLMLYCKFLIKRSSSPMILEEANTFITILKEFASMFSSLLRWIISLNFLFAIIIGFLLYIKGTMAISSVDLNWYDYFPIIAMVFMMAYLISLFYTLCTLSEKIANNVQDLKLEISKRCYQQEKADHILRELDDFKGFDADGYFTVNHSLLTGMATNFATFLVILIQFKQAESPSV